MIAAERMGTFVAAFPVAHERGRRLSSLQGKSHWHEPRGFDPWRVPPNSRRGDAAGGPGALFIRQVDSASACSVRHRWVGRDLSRMFQ